MGCACRSVVAPMWFSPCVGMMPVVRGGGCLLSLPAFVVAKGVVAWLFCSNRRAIRVWR